MWKLEHSLRQKNNLSHFICISDAITLTSEEEVIYLFIDLFSTDDSHLLLFL